jgi:hypothetical protein
MLNQKCKSIGCYVNSAAGSDFCEPCQGKEAPGIDSGRSLAERYPEQYKSLGDLTEIDIFAVHHLFQIQDPSGCLQYASRKLLIGGMPNFSDIREARDTLTRWLQLNQELPLT